MTPTVAAIVLTFKGLLFLIAAIIFAILAFYGTWGKADWPRGIASAAWCLMAVALFLWTAGL